MFATEQLEQSVRAALETYSNVHRGSGQASQASTHLYEQARAIVLESLGLDRQKYTVIFCGPRRAEALQAQLKPGSYHCLSSQATGLSLGVRALAVRRSALPKGIPFQTGGGTARLVSPGWVIWAAAPDRFEAGTPAIVNVIAFARALQLVKQFGQQAFQPDGAGLASPDGILYHDELEQFRGREMLERLRQTLVGRGMQVPTLAGMKPFINLDNAASTPTFTPVWQAVCQTWRQPEQVQRAIVGEVRGLVAAVLGAPLADYEVVFTSNTTEAINLAAESLGREAEKGIQPVVLNTLLEHNSNELPWRRLKNVSHIRISVDAEGFVDLAELETLLRAYNQEGLHGNQRIRLMAVSGASNVLGAYNDLAEIGRIVHKYGARLLVDGAQMVAHRRVDAQACGIDYLAFSAHKVYAPFGTGVLLAKKGLLNFSPAELSEIQASGEENAAGIAALGKALVLLQRAGLEVVQAEEQALTAQALRGLARIPGLDVYGVKDPDSPRFSQKGGVIPFGMQDRMSDRLAAQLAERGGIGVRSGCHCAHMLVKHVLNVSPFLQNLQRVILTLFRHMALPGVVRISLGIQNTAEQVDSLVAVLGEIARSPAGKIGNPFADKSRLPKTEIEQQMEAFTQAAAKRVFA